VRAEVFCLGEILHRQYSRYDRNADSGRAHFIEIPVIQVILEEELCNGTACAGIDLCFEHVDVSGDGGTIGMLLGIGGDRYFDFGKSFNATDQIGGVLVAVRVR